MSSNGGVFSLSAESGMEFLLCGDEGLVSFVIEGDVSEDSGNDERSDELDGGINGDGELGFGEFELRNGDLLKVDFEGSDESCFGKQVGSVVHAIEFIVEFFFGLGIFLNGLFDFDTEFEAEFIELFESVLVAHEFIKAILLNFKVWHFFESIDLLLYFSVDIIKTILSLFKLFPLISISINHQIM